MWNCFQQNVSNCLNELNKIEKTTSNLFISWYALIDVLFKGTYKPLSFEAFVYVYYSSILLLYNIMYFGSNWARVSQDVHYFIQIASPASKRWRSCLLHMHVIECVGSLGRTFVAVLDSNLYFASIVYELMKSLHHRRGLSSCFYIT